MGRFRNSREDYLFHKGSWSASQEGWRNQLVSQINQLDGDELLNSSTNDLAEFYVKQFFFEVPSLRTDEIVVEQEETQVDVRHDPMRWIEDKSRPFYVAGASVNIEVPFRGNKTGFEIQPSTSNFNNPRGIVGEEAIHFSIVGAELTPDKVKASIDERVSSIERHLQWLKADATHYNEGLNHLATQTIEHRKEKLLHNKSLVAGLGFKIKERAGDRGTFATPKVRRRLPIPPRRPTASREPFTPEPILADKDYEHILTVLENMVQVMEQSPGAFRDMDEESLRTHFLVQLNGHYEGDATGETFNYEGKTDILIKVDGKNIFIGECKFWAGEKAYFETIDQVLSYLSWRDTKAAVLIFSRNKDFSNVLKKIEECTPNHQHCKKQVQKHSESSWSYLFGHKDDTNRELTVTVKAFNIPHRIEPRVRRL